MRLYEKTNLSELLKETRLECKITQNKLAEKIGCSRETISRIENGQVEPCYAIFYRWLNVCGKQLIIRSSKRTAIPIEV